MFQYHDTITQVVRNIHVQQCVKKKIDFWYNILYKTYNYIYTFSKLNNFFWESQNRNRPVTSFILHPMEGHRKFRKTVLG